MTAKIARQLKPRYDGHEALNRVLRQDWIKSIELSPDHFEAYLFRPLKSAADDAPAGYEDDAVIEIDTNQDTLVYEDHELVAVVDCPDEQTSFFTMNDGGDNLGEGAEPLLLKIAATVPIGSVLEWDEETAEGRRTVWWYVHSAMGYGTANIGVIHACVPMRDFNSPPAAQTLSDHEQDETEQDETEALEVIEL